MTKQQEIEKGMFKILEQGQKSVGTPDGYPGIIAHRLLNYLALQGGMIRAKCPDCEWSQFEDEVVGMTPCYSCNSTGCTVEPLI